VDYFPHVDLLLSCLEAFSSASSSPRYGSRIARPMSKARLSLK